MKKEYLIPALKEKELRTEYFASDIETNLSGGTDIPPEDEW